MVSIRPVLVSDLNTLSELSKSTFTASHGHSASKKDIEIYLRYAYSLDKLEEEINGENSFFHFIYEDEKLAGYSKISLNTGYQDKIQHNATKLDRIYLKEEFQNKKLGVELFNFNLKLSISKNQIGMWLYTWIENKKAINFYLQNDFKIIDHADFKISSTHSNPNYIMYKDYKVGLNVSN